jgi:cell division protein FtsB
MQKLMAIAQAEIEKLRQENHNLKEENKTLRYQLKQVVGQF